MAEAAVHVPNDHLTRRLLRRSVAGDRPLAMLLEHLCTDTLYSVKDDFDDGLSEVRWQHRGFQWEPNDHQGGISTIRGEDEAETDGDSWLASRTFGWRGDRRPVVMARMRSQSKKFEFGFSDTIADGGLGLITKKSTPSAYTKADFVVACRDQDDDANVELFADGRAISLTTGTQTTTIDSALFGQSFSIMVALNEQSESRLWINGIPTSILRTGPNAQRNLCLWLQSRGAIFVDYIHAWQDRVALT